MHTPSYSEVTASLRKASMPVRELGREGRVAVIAAAGRIIAMAFRPDGPNLFWSHPQLGSSKLVEQTPGGFGGDRLWFAPELAYNWKGKPDWENFSNYATPAAMDPGKYEFLDQSNSQSIALYAKGELAVNGTDRRVGFEISRIVRLVEPPLPRNHPLMSGLDYIGVEASHVLKLADETRTGLIDLWHLLQIPKGSVLIVPVKKTADSQHRTLSYGLRGNWVERPDHVMWRYAGDAQAKFGLSAEILTGRSAVFRELYPGHWCAIVRDFPVDAHARYGDCPYGESRTDQAFQAWDGFGFGEMEFHSPVADAEHGPRELRETDRLWAFGGSPEPIAAIATRLLGVDVGYLFAPAAHLSNST